MSLELRASGLGRSRGSPGRQRGPCLPSGCLGSAGRRTGAALRAPSRPCCGAGTCGPGRGDGPPEGPCGSVSASISRGAPDPSGEGDGDEGWDGNGKGTEYWCGDGNGDGDGDGDGAGAGDRDGQKD